MPETQPHRPQFLHSLSFRLLLLTVFFVMLAEFFIWTPSIARYRKVYLEEHLARAHLSMLAVEVVPGGKIDKVLEKALLFHTEAYGIVLNRPDRRMLMISKDMPPKVDLVVDTNIDSFFGFIKDAFSTLSQNKNRILRVVGPSPKDPKVTIEVLIDEGPMQAAMWDYSRRILNLSVGISLFTAFLVYLSLQWLMVGPMRRITQSMTVFRNQPEDLTRTIPPSSRSDEIGIAQRELAVMQDELRAALQQKTRLAALGAAVAKINHDLRNSLATAMLASDRLAEVDDPEVKATVPKILNAIDRAVSLCSQTLNFVSDTELHLDRSRFALEKLAAEAGASVGSYFEGKKTVDWQIDIPDGLEITADKEQLFRALINLGQNAVEAGAAKVLVRGRLDGNWIDLDVIDDGPGLSQPAREKLFQPFAGSARNGGTGLGLVIVRDICRAHGGDVTLIGPEGSGDGPGEGIGATFRLRLPAGDRDSGGKVQFP
ncbi:MAG: HAMP domain-containing histidine kinase [Rhodospirillales bacterium]|nr:HAMP domain-containing histidine kinase [Rhodospirillales bacterium]